MLCVKDNITFSIKHIKEYLSREIIETTIPCSDIGHSYMFLMNEDKDDLLKEPGNRKTKINVAMHCTASQDGSVNKWNLVKNFILDPFPETFIYGKWDEKIIAGEHQNQFKETPMTDLHDVMYDTKYTLAIGGSRTWGTQSKFWKVNFLENNHDEYIKLWNECQELIHVEGLWDGSIFFNNLGTEISNIFDIQLEKKGTIDYKSSSIFLNKNESSLSDFFKQ